jgi:radical SAM superfamily enzyme YgiQ (UPF0313 family)
LDSARPSDSEVYDVFDYPREYAVVASRSCPYSCTFCYHPLGRIYRQRSMDSIFGELGIVVPKYKINIITIYDELFSHKEKRVYEFCARFREFRKKFDWDIVWYCQMRVEGLEEEMLDAMRDAGCFLVSYGFESYSDKILKSMRKKITAEQIYRAVHATMERQLSMQANFIFGDLAETLDTAAETLAFWRKHLPAGIMLGFILPFPNSEIYQHCIKKHNIKDRFAFLEKRLFTVLNMTDMSNSNFFRLKVKVFWHMNKYMKHILAHRREGDTVSVICPHCEREVQYTNYRTKKYLFRKVMYCRACRKRFLYVGLFYWLFVRISSVKLLSSLVFYLYEETAKLRDLLKAEPNY